jgi:5-formyltetrahydrofolate cyclo-ligase
MRKAARVRIAAMTGPERETADAAICARLLGLAEELDVSFVVAYLALADEARLDGFLDELARRGMPVFVPRVTVSLQIGLVAWSPDCRLVPDLEGVPSPEGACDWPAGTGLVVAPGRVFDTEGGRVGRGLGYYDRFLGKARQHATIAGAAYECQVVERVPREPHDAGIEWLVTEAARRRFAYGRAD